MKQSTYPSSQVKKLKDLRYQLEQSGPKVSPPTFNLLQTHSLTSSSRVYVNPISNINLLGYFPTKEWKDDPTMPDFVSYHKFKLGFYTVAEFDMTDASGKVHEKVTTVINNGDGDCNSGHWGGIFVETQCIAKIWSSGDTESTVEEENVEALKNDIQNNFVFQEYRNIEFPAHKESEEEEDDDDYKEEYFSGLVPGKCKSELEKILGVAMKEIMTSKNWRLLHHCLRVIK